MVPCKPPLLPRVRLPVGKSAVIRKVDCPFDRAPVHIMANVPRSEALKVLNQEGMLLVMCSLVDNMPYVLAEAAVSSLVQHC